MIELNLMSSIAREILTYKKNVRVTEPELLMEDPEQVEAYRWAGSENGLMAPVYICHCAHICEIIKEGDTVIDLGCGPANLLCLVADLNPKINFIGIDLSDEMLTQARNLVESKKLTNVKLICADVSGFPIIGNHSVNAVFSTMMMHHLPDITHLEKMFHEINRVLKPTGGVYLSDFGRLKNEKSIEYFSHQYQDVQPELFTRDYFNSLKAAFSVSEFKMCVNLIDGKAKFYKTFLVPFMIAFKSQIRRSKDINIQKKLDQKILNLPHLQKVDLDNLLRFFKLGGLKSCYF